LRVRVIQTIATTALGALVAMQMLGCGGSDSNPQSVSSVTHTRPSATTSTTRPPSTTERPRAHRAVFAFAAQALPQRIRRRIAGSSWHQGCPATLDELRYVEMTYWSFGKRLRHGVMIVNASTVPAVRTVFRQLFAKRFPIRRMHLVDDYGADDYTSIEADNTSSFNCRAVTGGTRWSEHAYGRAIDINPIENPYVYADGTTTHAASRRYLDRAQDRPGMALSGGVLVNAFDAVGWGWGGRWSPATDLQHFSANGR
jgi:hypothetical protein